MHRQGFIRWVILFHCLHDHVKFVPLCVEYFAFLENQVKQCVPCYGKLAFSKTDYAYCQNQGNMLGFRRIWDLRQLNCPKGLSWNAYQIRFSFEKMLKTLFTIENLAKVLNLLLTSDNCCFLPCCLQRLTSQVPAAVLTLACRQEQTQTPGADDFADTQTGYGQKLARWHSKNSYFSCYVMK